MVHACIHWGLKSLHDLLWVELVSLLIVCIRFTQHYTALQTTLLAIRNAAYMPT